MHDQVFRPRVPYRTVQSREPPPRFSDLRSRKAPSRIDRLLKLRRIWPVFCQDAPSVSSTPTNNIGKDSTRRGKGTRTSISLITIQIQLLVGRRRPDRLVVLDRLQPGPPATAELRVRPAAVGLQDAREAEHPGGELHVDEGDVRAEEEGPVRVRGVDDLGDFRLQLFGVLDLLVELLGLQVAVEGRDDVAVELLV